MSFNSEDYILDNKIFFNETNYIYCSRKRLNEIFDAKTHWVFAMTAESIFIAKYLQKLHLERLNKEIEIIALENVRLNPAFLMFPRDQFTLDEFAELIGYWPAPRKVIEEKDYIIVASENADMLMNIIQRWISVDHLLS